MHYDTPAVYGDVMFRAEFELNRYPIHYHLNDGENAESNPPVYTVESVPVTLAASFKSGDVFTGWSGSNGDEPQLTVTIPAGSTGEREYYANYLYSGRESHAAETPEADKIRSSVNEAYIRTSRSGSIARVYMPDGILRRQHTVLSAGTTIPPRPRNLHHQAKQRHRMENPDPMNIRFHPTACMAMRMSHTSFSIRHRKLKICHGN
ncbi:MAG: hypothetical protein LBL07_16190 [Tannerella sp.]|jgi:uncharacterized repeat protein (TIGR02543 family)|nr:hypothetical protein [Tannerella sp.]